MNMDGKPLKISIEDLPEDISSMPEDAEIVINDHDDIMDDEFWDDIDTASR